MQLSTHEALKLMRKLGMEMIESKHHVRGFLTVDGKRHFPVHCALGANDLPGDVADRFRRSLKLTLEEFAVLRGCTMGRDAYIALLRERGAVSL
jgi:hypothetical protein